MFANVVSNENTALFVDEILRTSNVAYPMFEITKEPPSSVFILTFSSQNV